MLPVESLILWQFPVAQKLLSIWVEPAVSLRCQSSALLTCWLLKPFIAVDWLLGLESIGHDLVTI